MGPIEDSKSGNGINHTVDTPIWLIYSGTGTDGGFGDYAEPVWSEEPVRAKDGRLLWFSDKASAERASEVLGKRESDAFYASGCHDAYDGDFPTEFRAFKTYVPADMSAGECSLDDTGLLDAVAFVGESSWGTYNEDGSRVEEDDGTWEDEEDDNEDEENTDDADGRE